MRILLLLLFFCTVAAGQTNVRVLVTGNGAPTSLPCLTQSYLDLDTGQVRQCNSGVWSAPLSFAVVPTTSLATKANTDLSNISGTVPFANSGGASAATSATSGTMTVNMNTRLITITPTGAATFNASGGTTGQLAVFSVTTSGSSSFTLTWGTNFKTTGTLATGTVTAKKFSVTFICLDGTTWQELARTGAM